MLEIEFSIEITLYRSSIHLQLEVVPRLRRGRSVANPFDGASLAAHILK